ncbi:MAG: hypothetical protein F2678_06875, partial [Actinobacteria bacterium]|nr:hypothetical protein [Actinomycetota bacterium]
MKLVAGIDIGNSTTEIVISNGAEPIAWDRRPTRGIKGSEASVKAALSLLQNIEREHNLIATQVSVAPWNPVETLTSTIHEPLPNTGKLQIIKTAHQSVVGDGWVVGNPWLITEAVKSNESAIAIVPSGTGYDIAANIINQAIAQGAQITGVVVADDEAVLIAKRVTKNLPVVDGADTATALRARKLFLEVRPQSTTVQAATDIWALRAALELTEDEATPLSEIVRWVRNDRTVLIGLFADTKSSIEIQNGFVTWRDYTKLDLFDAVSQMSNSQIGDITQLNIPDAVLTSDVWAFDITKVLAERGLRQVGHTRDLAIAQLAASSIETPNDLSEIFGVPVVVAQSEAQAAKLGAHSTPGLALDAAVLDIGGGTIDLISTVELSAAGAGELLTAAIVFALDTSRGAADWIKRGPAQRLESPHLLLAEDGSKAFTEESKTYPASAMGSLIAPGPAGYLTFGQNLQPAEWRIMR